MSSGKTETLGLNQWQLSDAFLMEEMNADNRKVDTSIHNVAESVAYRKLMDVTTGADAAAVDLDVSGINLMQYAKLEILASFQSNTTNLNASVYMSINNQNAYVVNASSTSGEYKSYCAVCPVSDNSSKSLSGFRAEVICPYIAPERIAYLPIRSIGSGNNNNVYMLLRTDSIMRMTATKINTVSFTGSAANVLIAAGSKITIYGVKL